MPSGPPDAALVAAQAGLGNAQAPYAMPTTSALGPTPSWEPLLTDAIASGDSYTSAAWSAASASLNGNIPAPSSQTTSNLLASSGRNDTETTQLSPSSIAAITVPLILVASGLVLLAVLNLVSRRKARRRRGSRSGPDLFDKDPSTFEESAWRTDSQSRWYALGLGMGDARASRREGAGYLPDALGNQALGRTPHWFSGPGRWMSGIGGGSLSSASRAGQRDLDSHTASSTTWTDPFRRNSDGVTVTKRDTADDEKRGVISEPALDRDTSTYNHIAGQVARSVEQAAYGSDDDLGSSPPAVLQPSVLLSTRSSTPEGETDCMKRTLLAAGLPNSRSVDSRTDPISISRNNVAAASGFHSEQANIGRCLTSPSSAGRGPLPDCAATRASINRQSVESPSSHNPQELTARNAARDYARMLDLTEGTMSRVRNWRITTDLDEVDSLASPPQPRSTNSAATLAPAQPTPSIAEPSPILSPLSVFEDDHTSTTSLNFGGSSTKSLDKANLSNRSGRWSVNSSGSTTDFYLEDSYAEKASHLFAAGGLMSQHSYPVSAPRSPSISTESIHPRRHVLAGRSGSASAASLASVRPIHRYAPSCNSTSFVTARSERSDLARDHPFAIAYPRAPNPSSHLHRASSAMPERERFDSISTIRPGQIAPISAVPERLTRSRRNGNAQAENHDEVVHGTGVHPIALARKPRPSRAQSPHSRRPSSVGDMESEMTGAWSLVREKTRKGAAWERSILSGL